MFLEEKPIIKYCESDYLEAVPLILNDAKQKRAKFEVMQDTQLSSEQPKMAIHNSDSQEVIPKWITR